MSYRQNPKSNIYPRIYALPKIHKEEIPLWQVVYFTGENVKKNQQNSEQMDLGR